MEPGTARMPPAGRPPKAHAAGTALPAPPSGKGLREAWLSTQPHNSQPTVASSAPSPNGPQAESSGWRPCPTPWLWSPWAVGQAWPPSLLPHTAHFSRCEWDPARVDRHLGGNGRRKRETMHCHVPSNPPICASAAARWGGRPADSGLSEDLLSVCLCPTREWLRIFGGPPQGGAGGQRVTHMLQNPALPS